jgi:hypothetical protein
MREKMSRSVYLHFIFCQRENKMTLSVDRIKQSRHDWHPSVMPSDVIPYFRKRHADLLGVEKAALDFVVLPFNILSIPVPLESFWASDCPALSLLSPVPEYPVVFLEYRTCSASRMHSWLDRSGIAYNQCPESDEIANLLVNIELWRPWFRSISGQHALVFLNCECYNMRPSVLCDVNEKGYAVLVVLTDDYVTTETSQIHSSLPSSVTKLGFSYHALTKEVK